MKFKLGAEILKSKTFWAAIGGVVTAIGSAVVGIITPVEAAQVVWAAFLAIFVRDGMTGAK